jgi:hypothetical protein
MKENVSDSSSSSQGGGTPDINDDAVPPFFFSKVIDGRTDKLKEKSIASKVTNALDEIGDGNGDDDDTLISSIRKASNYLRDRSKERKIQEETTSVRFSMQEVPPLKYQSLAGDQTPSLPPRALSSSQNDFTLSRADIQINTSRSSKFIFDVD